LKAIVVFASLILGVVLAAFSTLAFFTVGIVLAVCAFATGVFLLVQNRLFRYSVVFGIASIALGLALAVICLVFYSAAIIIIGGSVLLLVSLGLFVFIKIFDRSKKAAYLCSLCLCIFGLLFIFYPDFAHALTVAAGIFLIAYSVVFAIYL